jgi:hypothetical protein
MRDTWVQRAMGEISAWLILQVEADFIPSRHSLSGYFVISQKTKPMKNKTKKGRTR